MMACLGDLKTRPWLSLSFLGFLALDPALLHSSLETHFSHCSGSNGGRPLYFRRELKRLNSEFCSAVNPGWATEPLLPFIPAVEAHCSGVMDGHPSLAARFSYCR